MKNRGHNKKLLSRLAGLTYILMVITTLVFQVLNMTGHTIQEILFQTQHILLPPWWNYWVWILILILLGLFNIYQMSFNMRRPDNNDRVVRRVNLFSVWIGISFIAWVIVGSFLNQVLALIAFGFLFIGLYLARTTISNRSSLSDSEVRSIVIPFSLFYSYGLVIFIQQVFSQLIQMKTFTDHNLWAVYGLGLAGLLLMVSILAFKDIWIGLGGLWSFVGLVAKYLLSEDLSYPIYNIVLIANLVILVLAMIFVQLQAQKKNADLEDRSPILWNFMKIFLPITIKYSLKKETLSFLQASFALKDKGTKVVDLACGSGTYALALADSAKEVFGYDLDPYMIDQANKKRTSAM